MRKEIPVTILITAVFVGMLMMAIKITPAYASVWKGKYEVGYQHSDSSLTSIGETNAIWNPPGGLAGMSLYSVNFGYQPYASHLVVVSYGSYPTYAELGIVNVWGTGFYVYFTWAENNNIDGHKISITSANMPVELELNETAGSSVTWTGFYSLDEGTTWNLVLSHTYSSWQCSDWNTLLETNAQPNSNQGDYAIVENYGLWYEDNFGTAIGYIPTSTDIQSIPSNDQLLVDWYPVPQDYGWACWVPLTTATDTRYFRSDTQTVNGLTAYKFETSSTSSEHDLFTRVGWGTWDVTWGIRVWLRASNGIEYELTDGTPVAVVTAPCGYDRAQYQATFTPKFPPNAENILQSSVVIRVYSQVGGGGWILRATFTTGQLSVFTLENVQWTVNYSLWTEVRDTGNGVQSGENPLHETYETVEHFYFGVSSDSYITNFKWLST